MPKMKGQGQGQSKEQKSKNPNSSFSKSWSLARGSVRAPGRKNIESEQTAWTRKVANVFLCKKNISALVGDAGVGRLHIEDLHQGGGDTGRNVSSAKLVV